MSDAGGGRGPTAPMASTAPMAPMAGDLFEFLGERRFRVLELAALERLLEDRDVPEEGSSSAGLCVLATGGGCVETPRARALLAERTVCLWLREDVARLAARLEADAAHRPSITGAAPAAELAALEERRGPLYASLAHLSVDGRGEGVPELTERALQELPPLWRAAAASMP